MPHTCILHAFFDETVLPSPVYTPLLSHYWSHEKDDEIATQLCNGCEV